MLNLGFSVASRLTATQHWTKHHSWAMGSEQGPGAWASSLPYSGGCLSHLHPTWTHPVTWSLKHGVRVQLQRGHEEGE